jgi:aspartyl protease family protein
MVLRILVLYLCLMPAAYAVKQLEVQGLFSGKAVLMIDGQRHILGVGKTSPEGVKVISADSHSTVLEVEGVQKKYVLGNTVSTVYKKSESVKEQVVANNRGMFFTHGSVNGQSVKFLIDTGATSVAMSGVDAKRLGILYRMDGQETRASTASGVVKSWAIKLKSVTVGKIKQKNVQAMVVDGSHPTEILLGMSFMERLKVNKEGSILTLEQKN